MPIKVIYESSGRGKATIMRILAAAKELPRNKGPKYKFGDRRRRKTSRFTDTVMKRELQKKSSFNGIGSADSSIKFVEKCHNSHRASPPPKELGFAKP